MKNSEIPKYKKSIKNLAKLVTKKNDENVELKREIFDLERSNNHISGASSYEDGFGNRR